MKNLILFFKGLFMGISDLVPGISGGTIALITGIYGRLISAINGLFDFLRRFLIESLTKLFNKKKKISHKREDKKTGDKKTEKKVSKKSYGEIKKRWEELDLGFLFTLFCGVFIAILIGSRLIGFLFEGYYIYIMAFFVGLILSSCIIIFDNIKTHNLLNYFIAFFGFCIGLTFVFLSPTEANLNEIILFGGGFFAVSAMFLPGISGSFILLVMGIYEKLIDLVQNIFENAYYLSFFILGALVGVAVISKIVNYLFKKDKSKTLYFLLGLVLGSLGVPLLRSYEAFKIQEINPIMTLLLFLVGVSAVIIIRHCAKKGLENSLID